MTDRSQLVKPLVWSEYDAIEQWDAEAGSFGVFYGIELHHDGFRAVFDHEGVGALGTFDTLDAAKAAAQADYTARILSAMNLDAIEALEARVAELEAGLHAARDRFIKEGWNPKGETIQSINALLERNPS